MARFEIENELMANPRVLKEDYVPDELPARDEQMDEYEFALLPIVRGSGPKNVFAYGETGVGKTVCAEQILSELEDVVEDRDQIELEVVWCNCKEKTSYQVAIELVNTLREPGEQISPNGYSLSGVMSMLWVEVNDLDATDVVFVLDEVDSLGTDDALLYKLPRAKKNGDTDKDLGVIGICNDFTFRESLSSRVKSTLQEVEIHFGPYDANELGEILDQRAELAFMDGALGGGTIPYISAVVAQDSGSARDALDILRLASEIAEARGDDYVSEDHAEEAHERLEEVVLEKELRSMPIQTHAILKALASMDRDGALPARRKVVYGEYRSVAEENAIDVKTSRTILDRLSQLSLKGIVSTTERNKGRTGGKYFEYDLDVDPNMIEDIVDF